MAAKQAAEGEQGEATPCCCVKACLGRVCGQTSGVSALANVAEARIQEAMEAGELRAPLEGAGRPLDLDAYFAAPASLRAAFGFLKSAHLVPPEVEAMRAVHSLRLELEKPISDEHRALLTEELRLRETEVAMALERMKRTIRVDAGL